jgi:hypothetical protein
MRRSRSNRNGRDLRACLCFGRDERALHGPPRLLLARSSGLLGAPVRERYRRAPPPGKAEAAAARARDRFVPEPVLSRASRGGGGALEWALSSFVRAAVGNSTRTRSIGRRPATSWLAHIVQSWVPPQVGVLLVQSHGDELSTPESAKNSRDKARICCLLSAGGRGMMIQFEARRSSGFVRFLPARQQLATALLRNGLPPKQSETRELENGHN